MKISVIIPSLNSPIIDKVIEAIESQNQKELIDKIIIIGKDEQGLIHENDHIYFIDTIQPVKASIARNIGIDNSPDADLLIFIDSDCYPQKNWLSQHIAAHEAGHPVVGGGVMPKGCNYWHLVYNLTLFHEFLSVFRNEKRDYLPTLNLSIEKFVIDKIGGMDENIDRVEDIDWTTRIRRNGIQPYFWPAASIFHDHNRNTFKKVWDDCAHSGFHMRELRLKHSDMLKAPKILKYKHLLLLLSPFIAFWGTFSIIKENPAFFLRHWHTVAPIFATKIAWCWGASRKNALK